MVTIANEIQSLVKRFPQNKKQLLEDNAFNIVAFGLRIWTFSDGSAIKEAI